MIIGIPKIPIIDIVNKTPSKRSANDSIRMLPRIKYADKTNTAHNMNQSISAPY
jgi:hypothetical protein